MGRRESSGEESERRKVSGIKKIQKSSKDSGTSSDSSSGSDSSDEEDSTDVKKRVETVKASTAQSRSDVKGPKKLKNTTGKRASAVNDKNEKVPQMETAAAKG